MKKFTIYCSKSLFSSWCEYTADIYRHVYVYLSQFDARNVDNAIWNSGNRWKYEEETVRQIAKNVYGKMHQVTFQVYGIMPFKSH